MALDAKVGSFDFPNTTGNFSVTGVGFQPKLVLFFEARLDTFGTAPDLNTMFGAAASSTQEWAVHNESIDGVATSQADRASRENQCIFIRNADHAADFVSMDADGFTISVNTTESDTSTPKVAYIALGGSDISNVQVGNFTAPSASGNDSVTGVGFQPDCLLFSTIGSSPANDDSSIECIYSLGAATNSTNQWVTAPTSYDGQSTTDTGRYQRTNKCVCQQLRGSVSWEADLVSMDADGFTLNYSASTGGDIVFYVAIKGAQFNVLDFAETNTSGTNVSQSVTGVGFQPSALLLSGWGRPASTALQDESVYALGAATGAAEEQAVSFTDEHAVGTTNANSSHQSNRIYEVRSPSTFAIVSDAELTSLDSDGFTLNWLNTDGGQDQILGLAIGEADTGGISGTAAQDLQPVTQTASGSLSFSGSIDQTLASLTQSASGDSGSLFEGSAAQTLQTVTQSSSGSLQFSGTADQALSAVTQSSSGGLTFTGTAAQTLSAIVQSATGSTSGGATGTASQTLPFITQDATGTITFTATGGSVLPAITQSAQESEVIVRLELQYSGHRGNRSYVRKYRR